MKRQFKPNNKVKHIESKAKRYLAIGKWHERRYEKAVTDSQYWAEGYWTEKRKNDELQSRLNAQFIRFNKNESELIKELMDQEKMITELRSERNHSLMVLAGVIATITIVAFW